MERKIPNPARITFDPYNIPRSSFDQTKQGQKEYEEFREMVSDREAWTLWLCMCCFLKSQYFAGQCVESAKYLRKHGISEKNIRVCVSHFLEMDGNCMDEFMDETLAYLRGEKRLEWKIEPSTYWREQDRELVIRRLKCKLEVDVGFDQRKKILETITAVADKPSWELEERRTELLELCEA